MPKGNFRIELEGDLGEMDYGGVTLSVADKITERATKEVLLPEVKRRINTITGETEASLIANRVGFFNPRGRVEPMWKVFTQVLWGRVLEYADGGKNSFMRTAARSRRVKSGIRMLIKQVLGPEMKAQIRNRKRRRR
jgi:fatty acid-binding protein DegV